MDEEVGASSIFSEKLQGEYQMRIDVIIPTLHPGKEFAKLLKRLESQQLAVPKIVIMNTRC